MPLRCCIISFTIMRITGFTKMGFSGIPFVKTPSDFHFAYLHHLDSDENMPDKSKYPPIMRPYMYVKDTTTMAYTATNIHSN